MLIGWILGIAAAATSNLPARSLSEMLSSFPYLCKSILFVLNHTRASSAKCHAKKLTHHVPSPTTPTRHILGLLATKHLHHIFIRRGNTAHITPIYSLRLPPRHQLNTPLIYSRQIKSLISKHSHLKAATLPGETANAKSDHARGPSTVGIKDKDSEFGGDLA